MSVGDDLADIETEKITGTLEAADAGTVRRIVARVGEDVPVSGTIALIAPAGRQRRRRWTPPSGRPAR